MFQVGLGDGSVLGHSNNTLSANYSYGSLSGLNNGPLSLHYTKRAILIWQNKYKYFISTKKSPPVVGVAHPPKGGGVKTMNITSQPSFFRPTSASDKNHPRQTPTYKPLFKVC